jgi:hypothetical protein
MGRVTLHFSEEEYQLFHHYCANYCNLYDETRKNSIRILLELYKHRVINLEAHDLDNVFSFFYQKKQEFETESQIQGSDPSLQMRVRICTDIIAFLEDLEKLYRLIRKKGIDANYFLIIGTFSEIADEEDRARRESLAATSATEINEIVIPLATAIEKKFGQNVDTTVLLGEFANFVDNFNRLSPQCTFNNEIISLVTVSLLRKFNKEEPTEDIPELLKRCRDQFESDELESALEGVTRTPDVWDLDFPWESLVKPLSTLNERIAQSQIPMVRSREVIAALEAPVKTWPALPDYSPLTLYQNPTGLSRRRNEDNQILVMVDNRPHSEVQLAGASDYIAVVPSTEYPHKQYFPLATGVMILVILILASIVFGFTFGGGSLANNSSGQSTGSRAGVFAASGMDPAPTTLITPIPPLSVQKPVTRITPTPTPVPTPQYVTVEPIIPEPIVGPVSHQQDYAKLATVGNFLFNPAEYITIFGNDYEYNLVNAYKISFDLKNPPMLIRYNVVPHNLTDVKWFEPHDSADLIDTAIINRPDEEAWFEVKIYKNGTLYDQEGWGRSFTNPLGQQEIVIRDTGKYQIEFSGHEANVSTQVLVKKQGNI